MVLEALLRDGGEPTLQMAGRTLEAMARGRIYDQLGGGFARYSVDAAWVVPHSRRCSTTTRCCWAPTRIGGAAPATRCGAGGAETVGWLLREMRLSRVRSRPA